MTSDRVREREWVSTCVQENMNESKYMCERGRERVSNHERERKKGKERERESTCIPLRGTALLGFTSAPTSECPQGTALHSSSP